MSDAFVTLTSVGPKPFLNINCNVLTANEVIDQSAVSSLFSFTQSGFANVLTGTSLTIGIDTAVIANSSFNTGTSIFTVPVDGDYRFDVSFNVANTVANQEVIMSLTLVVNGVNLPAASIVAYPGPAVSTRQNTISFFYALPLVTGNTVGFRLSNGGASTTNVVGGRFVGQLQ